MALAQSTAMQEEKRPDPALRDEDEMFARATRAYLRRLEREGAMPQQPFRAASDFDEDGTFALRNVRGDLARYSYNVNTGGLPLHPDQTAP